MAFKERIVLKESQLAFVAPDKELVYKQPVMLKEAELLLRGSEKFYEKGRECIRTSVFFAILGLLGIIALILDLPLVNGKPFFDIGDNYYYVVVILTALMDLIAFITGLVGKRRVYQAYAAIYRRSEIYRHGPHVL